MKPAVAQKARDGSAARVWLPEPENIRGSGQLTAPGKIRRLSQLPLIGGMWRFITWWLVFFGMPHGLSGGHEA